MKKLKIAVIGIGQIGKKYAYMIEKEEVPHMELAAVCCRSEENKEWAKRNLSSAVQICQSSDLLYKKSDFIDGIIIATPHKTHEELAIQAFKNGKDVLCDKPAGISVLQAEKIYNASIKYGKTYGLIFHQRLYERYSHIKKMMEKEELGEIKRILLEDSRYFRTMNYHKSGSWRSSWNGEGGGGLINQGQHILDIWQWLFGMPESIYGEIPFGKYNDFSVDDEATIIMRYSDKKIGTFILTTGEGSSTEKIEVTGTRGRILLDQNRLYHWKYGQDTESYRKEADCFGREKFSEDLEIKEFGENGEPYQRILENFAQAVLENVPLTAEGRDGRKSLELANAAYLSAWLGKPVSLPLNPQSYEEELEKRRKEENLNGLQ